MSARRIPQRGDIYWVDPNPIAGHEMRDRHPFIVITPKEINKFGVSMTVPITSHGNFAQKNGLTVLVQGAKIKGAAVCNQVRSFDLQAREDAGTAKFSESLDSETISEIVTRVVSIIDPA